MSNSPSCCFIWIPKTAGTSVFNWLHHEIGMQKLRDYSAYRFFPNKGAVTFGHSHYLSLLSSGFINKNFHSNCTRFTIVRNPYDRVISLYLYLMKHGNFNASFFDFLCSIESRRVPIGAYNVAGNSQSNRQVDWLLDSDGDWLPHHIYRQEDLSVLEQELPEILGWHPKTKLARHNAGDHNSEYPIFLGDARCVAKINTLYKADFELLGYDMREI